MADEKGKALDWDDKLTGEDSSFVLLDPGEYDFTVTDFQRAQFNGSAKMEAGPMAKLVFSVDTSSGTANVYENIILNEKMMGKLKAFFRAIGQRKKDEEVSMDWKKVVGSSGRAVFGQREYDGRKYNQVERYIFPEDKPSGKYVGVKL